MKIVYDNGEYNINRIPMAYACCDKCETPVRFALGFVNEPLINPWDTEEHKYCERCGAFMDWETVSIKNQYNIFLADRDKQIRAEVIEEYKSELKTDVCARAQNCYKDTFNEREQEIFNFATKTFLDALDYFAEQLKEQK